MAKRRIAVFSAMSVLCGLVMLAGSRMLDRDSWLGDVLIQFGSTLLLLAPLLWLGKGFERDLNRLEADQQEIADRQRQTAHELATLSREMAASRDKLSSEGTEVVHRVTKRLAELSEKRRDRDDRLFETVIAKPSPRDLAARLRRAKEIGAIAFGECRVRLRGLPYYATFSAHDDLIVCVEDELGEPRDHHCWREPQNAEDLLLALSERIHRVRRFPPDVHVVDPSLLTDIQHALLVAYQLFVRAADPAVRIDMIVQYCPPQWVITTDSIACIDDGLGLVIRSRRPNRWQIRRICAVPGVDKVSFEQAVADARKLYRRDKSKYRFSWHN